MSGQTNGPGAVRVALYVRAGCHLCDAARAVVAEVAGVVGIAWSGVDVDGDAELVARYGELVPAVTVDGVLIDYWRVDPHRLAQAIA